MENIRLIKGNKENLKIAKNLVHYYIYDMGVPMGWDPNSEGVFDGCDEMSENWISRGYHSYLIYNQDIPIGFAMVKEIDEEFANYEIEEFFILRGYRTKGIGKDLSSRLFNKFSGDWQVRVLEDNTPAIHFWEKVIDKFSHNRYKKEKIFHCCPYSGDWAMVRFLFKSLDGDNCIETDRLILRYPQINDAKDIFSFMRNPKLSEFMCWKPRVSIEETAGILSKQIDDIKRDPSWIKYCLVDKNSHKVIGSLNGKIKGCKIDLTYMLSEDYWHQGLMSEAILGFIEMIKEKRKDISAIIASCDTENLSSIALLEKLGFKKVSTLEKVIVLPNISSEKRDLFCYELKLSRGSV